MHFENLLFILLIAMAALLRLLATRAGEAKKRPEKSDQRSTTTPQVSEPIRRAPVESDEERIRKFLEALGQPATSRPPPPVVPRTDISPRPLAPVRPPPVLFPAPRSRPSSHGERRKSVVISQGDDVGTPGEWLRKINYPRGIPETPYEKGISEPRVAEPPTFEVHEGAPPAELPPIVKTPAQAYAAATRPPGKLEQRKTEIANLLTSTSGLRNAIILREIFGPPRSLQPLDLLRSA
jgi:hypothetical protein